jgi:hypothetical protein
VRLRLTHLALGAIVGLVAVGCSANAGCGDPSVTFEVTVTDEAMDPSALTACRGQAVVLVITSQTDGEFHLHGYDDQVGETQLEPGEETTIEFEADVAGQFIIELHSHAEESETEIGVLTVNEP